MRFKIYILLSLCVCGLLLLPLSVSALNAIKEDTIPIHLGSNITKPIYTQGLKKHSKFYKKLWSEHYRAIYYVPVTTKTISLNSLFGGLSIVEQLPKLHSIILEDKIERLYLLKPLGGSSSFLESKFFQSVYNKDDFSNTYLGDFINEAYTIVHPYSFLASARLADAVNIKSSYPQLAYISRSTVADTIADGTLVRDKLVSISQIPDLKNEEILNNIDDLLKKLNAGDEYKLDIQVYIRTRLFDMLIGDWNKVGENWSWIPEHSGDTIYYVPQVLDRNHAFSKVDGVFFKELLRMLGVGFISNYESRLKNPKKFNQLAYPLDIALTQQTHIDIWLEQARYLKEILTDNVIDEAFLALPKEVQGADTEYLATSLKNRRNNIEDIARRYFNALQQTPVITGTDKNDRFVIETADNKSLRIRIFNEDNGQLTLDRTYKHKPTKEIWIYGLGGDDNFEVDKRHGRIPVLLIGGKGKNNYNIKNGENVSVYESESQKERFEGQVHTKVIYPNNEKSLEYDYQKLRYTEWSFTPIGIYDSDLGLNIGTSVAYTIYGFRRAPYTRRHQLSFNYSSGFTYQGIFPSYDQRKRFHVSAFLGSSAYFNNFFGFGNETEGFKNKRKKYNRVNIDKYTVTPAFYYTINTGQEIYVSSSFEVYKVDSPKGRNRYINELYDDENSIFERKYFANIGITYDVDKEWQQFISSFKFMLTTGWNVNIGNPKKNYPYLGSHLGVNLKFSDRITFATLMKGKLLFSDKYEFYQSATTELRGFRDNRFIGKQSFYQYTDIRYDMGKLENPLTPLNYGFFAGTDYGRVWYPGEHSKKWHSSYGGGFWLTLLRKFTGKFSYFGSTDGSRFSFELGMGF